MSSQQDPPGRGPTLTSSGIARLADVGRPAVSNWRRRYSDFPAPVAGTPGSPQFDAHDVEQWLRRQGKLHDAGLETLAWRPIENYQPAAQLEDALIAAGAYLLAGGNHQGTLTTPKQIVSRLRKMDQQLADQVSPALPHTWTPQLTTVLATVAELGREREPDAAFEYLHHRYLTSAQSMSGLAHTPDDVVELMLDLAGTGATTFDFTSGTGSILRLAAERTTPDATPTRIYGQEIKPQYAQIALLRLWLVHQRLTRNGRSAPAPDVRIGDSLLADAFPDLRADAVVANFPFGIHDWGHSQLAYDPRWVHGVPPRTEPELAWVQHALAHLRIGGTAAVLMPPAAAHRPAGRRIRAELVRSGALRAVIALPPDLMPPAGISLHIWVLTQPDPQSPPDDRLLFVDTTTVETSFAEPAIKAWHDYRSRKTEEDSSVHRVVPAIQLLDREVDLTPWRHLNQAGHPTRDPSATLNKIRELDDLIARARADLPTVRASSAPATPTPHATMADLIRSGSIAVLQYTAARSRAGAPPHHDNKSDTASSPRIEAGDILIPTTNQELVARIATPEQVGTELRPGLQLVRVNADQFDPWFVAGALSLTHNARVAGRASSAGSSMRRIDVKRLAVPVLPLNQQREQGAVFRQLVALTLRLREIATTGESLYREINDGIMQGTLIPESE